MLCNRYERSRRHYAAAREALIEKMGDALCSASLPPPSQQEIDQLEELAQAENAARELYERGAKEAARHALQDLNSRQVAQPAHEQPIAEAANDAAIASQRLSLGSGGRSRSRTPGRPTA
ncbi:hypothetical protein VARIO8X_130134 [Burkholderiales bacterium 8X]|nr:hypothetical protein VARIO8X_130134 [Burkholderiales bacterium 8X]